MIRSNYVQVTRAKATLVSRVYHRVSPARITRLRLGDTCYSLQKRIIRLRLGDTVSSLQNCITKAKRQSWIWSLLKRITRLRLGDTGFSLQKCITDQNRCSPLKERIGNTITLEKPNGYKFKTSRYRIVVTGLVSESQ